MPRPDLPDVRRAEWIREYRLSGACPPRAIGIMLGLAVGGGSVIGFVGYWGGWLTYWLAEGAGSFGRSAVGWLMAQGMVGTVGGVALAAGIVLVILGIAFGYPFLLGTSFGRTLASVARAAKCRNLGVVVTFGVLGGVVAWGTLALIGLLQDGIVRESSRVLSAVLFEHLGILGVLAVVVDAAVIVLYSVAGSAATFADVPFCEVCGKWYSVNRTVSVAAATARPLVTGLASGSALLLGPRRSDDPSRLELRLQRCECSSADAVLTADLRWGEPVMKNGAISRTVQKEERWFATVVPNQLGLDIEQALFAGAWKAQKRGPGTSRRRTLFFFNNV